MWTRKIAPYIGESELDREPFAEWYPRVREHIEHVPEDVADQWIHDNWAASPYEFLPLEQLRFERQRWTLSEIDRVRFGRDWGENASDVHRLDDEHVQQTWLAQFMLREKTWPRPIIVLDNQHGLVCRGEQLARWHLLEGHLRLTYLRCLQHKGIALAEHEVWCVTPPETVLVVDDRSSNPQPTYAHEKLSNAIRYLAIGSGSIHDRLRDVLQHSGIERVSRDDFPGDMRERWDLLTTAWKQPLDDRAAHHFAREVVEFYSWVCYRLGEWWLDERRPEHTKA